MEMSKILPMLVRHFNFTIVNKENPWVNHQQWFEGKTVPLLCYSALTSGWTVQSDFFVKVHKREL